MSEAAADSTLTYCPFGTSPFGEACGRPRLGGEPSGARAASCPAEPPDETVGDLVRLLARSQPSYRRADPCLWSK